MWLHTLAFVLALNPQPKLVLKAQLWVCTLAISPDNQLLAAIDRDNEDKVWLWDLTTGKVKNQIRSHLGWVCDVAFSPDGKTLALVGGDPPTRLNGPEKGEFILWDVPSAKERFRAESLNGSFHCVAFSPDRKTLATGGDGGRVTLWDISGKDLHTFQEGSSNVTALAYSPDGRSLASGSASKILHVWDVAERSERLAIPVGRSGGCANLTFTRDNLILIAATGDVTTFHDAANGQQLYRAGQWDCSWAYRPN